MSLSISSPTPDATTTTKGKVQLAGDLAGTAALPVVGNAKITPSKLNLGSQTASVATSQTTASLTYTDLTTTGPAVTVTIGANLVALIIITASVASSAAGAGAAVSWAASGANTIAAADTQAFYFINAALTGSVSAVSHGSAIFFATGLTAGSTTFTAKYRASGSGTATFDTRSITVIPL